MAYVLGADFDRCVALFPAPATFGEDVRYDPLYEGLRVEIDKLTSGASQSGIDWKGVRKSSVELLSTKSKDLTVAAYLTLALFYMEGYGGLADGLDLVLRYVGDGWDGIFPLRPKPRAGAIQMLSERLNLYLGARPPEPSEAALAATVRERLDALQKLVAERLPDAISFGSLNQTLREQLEAAPPPEAGASSPVATGDVASDVPPPAAATPATPALAPNAGADEVADRIRTLIPALRQADPLSPVPYRLLRSLKWDPLPAPPPLDAASVSPGTTRIPPPRTQQKLALEGLFTAGHWAELLRASEAAFQEATGTFWLDLQRYTAAALNGLDREAGKRPAAAVEEEVVRLLKRFDTLPTLYFADRKVPNPGKPSELIVERTPFASDATRQWLDSLQSAASPGEAPMALPAARAAVDAGEPALSPADARKVQDLLAKQQPGGAAAAFDLLQAAIDRAPHLRARFRARLAAARLCLQANQAGWARTLLEELLRESEVVSFEDWEPETAVDLYQLLALCYARPAKRGGPQDADAAREQLETLRRKLFRLDLRAAAALEEALRR
jgi:type VI secretion system protein VasJ